jgi:hypothetical protein
MPKFTTNTISINYNVYGTGIPVLLLHGALVDFIIIVRLAGLKAYLKWVSSKLIFVVMVKVTKAMIQIFTARQI